MHHNVGIEFEVLNRPAQILTCRDCGIGTCTQVRGEASRSFQPDQIVTETYHAIAIMGSFDACPWNREEDPQKQALLFLRWLQLTGLARHAVIVKYMLGTENMSPIPALQKSSLAPIITEYQPAEPFTPHHMREARDYSDDVGLQRLFAELSTILPISEVFYPEKIGSHGFFKATILPAYRKYFPQLRGNLYEIDITVISDPQGISTVASIKDGEFLLDVSDGFDKSYFIAQLVFQLFIMSGRNERLLQELPEEARDSYFSFKRQLGLFSAIERLAELKTISLEIL